MNKKLTKEEFLEKLKTDKDFNKKYGRKDITEGKQVLPPCHYGFQVYTRELSYEERCDIFKPTTDFKTETNSVLRDLNIEIMNDTETPTRAISLMWNQRSVDTFLGLPFNIASYGLLLEMIAKEVNMVPDELIGNLGDVHLYSNHVDQAMEQIGRELTFKEKLQWVMRNTDIELENVAITEAAAALRKSTREPYPLPTLKLGHFGSILENISVVDLSDFIIEGYQSHPTIKAPLSN